MERLDQKTFTNRLAITELDHGDTWTRYHATIEDCEWHYVLGRDYHGKFFHIHRATYDLDLAKRYAFKFHIGTTKYYPKHEPEPVDGKFDAWIFAKEVEIEILNKTYQWAEFRATFRDHEWFFATGKSSYEGNFMRIAVNVTHVNFAKHIAYKLYSGAQKYTPPRSE